MRASLYMDNTLHTRLNCIRSKNYLHLSYKHSIVYYSIMFYYIIHHINLSYVVMLIYN